MQSKTPKSMLRCTVKSYIFKSGKVLNSPSSSREIPDCGWELAAVICCLYLSRLAVSSASSIRYLWSAIQTRNASLLSKPFVGTTVARERIVRVISRSKANFKKLLLSCCSPNCLLNARKRTTSAEVAVGRMPSPSPSAQRTPLPPPWPNSHRC